MDKPYDETAVWQRVTAQKEETELSPLYPGLKNALTEACARLGSYRQLRHRDSCFPPQLIALSSREITLLRGIITYLTGSPCSGGKSQKGQSDVQIPALMTGLDRTARSLETLSELAAGELRNAIYGVCGLERQQFHLLLEVLGNR